jgi:gliding-associated putative ABC transporter substrate-binding component GldG
MEHKKTTSIYTAYIVKICILIMVLLIGSYVYGRLDISRGKAFSIGKHSRDVASNLKSKMVLKIYASKDLPVTFARAERYLRDILAEFKRAGKGKFAYDYPRFQSYKDLMEQASLNGLQALTVPTYENDQPVMKDVVLGIVFESQGNHNTLLLYPGVESTLEYEITKIMQVLDNHILPKVTMFADSSYVEYPTQLFTSEMNGNYQYSITSLDSLPDPESVLLFTGTERNLLEEQLYNLDQFIMRGGKLVMLQDRITNDENSVIHLESNVIDLLSHYGITIHPNMVLDEECDQRQMGIGRYVPFKFYPVARGVDSHPISKGLNNVVMYFTSEISPRDSVNIKWQPLLKTSGKSGKIAGPNYDVRMLLDQKPGQQPLQEPPITVGALASGKFKSYFASHPFGQRPGFVASTSKAEIVLLADRELIVDPDKPEFLNRCFIILNAIDYFSGNTSMIGIRNRSTSSSRLDIQGYLYSKGKMYADPAPAVNRIKLAFRLIAITVPPILLILTGLLLNAWRSTNERKKYALS